MKTTIIAVILSITTGTLIAQTQEYYRNGNTLKCNGTEYVVIKENPIGHLKIMDKEDHGSDLSYRTKDGKKIMLEAFANTGDVINFEMIDPAIKHIMNKYGFDIYNNQEISSESIPLNDRTYNSVYMTIFFEENSKKVKSIRYFLPGYDTAKASTVPIEVYDEISKELKRILAFSSNDLGKLLLYCSIFYMFVLK